MCLILSNSVANLLQIVSQVSCLYLTDYNLQFISIKIDYKHRTTQLFHCPCPFHVCQRRFATEQNASAAYKIDFLSARISSKPCQRTNFHWAIKRADMSLTTHQIENYANIREEAFLCQKKQTQIGLSNRMLTSPICHVNIVGCSRSYFRKRCVGFRLF